MCALAEKFALSCHGLSLSLGGPTPLDVAFVREVRVFLELYNVPLYSEHLSYCSDDGHLYDLMPLAFDEATVAHVAERIDRVQQRLCLRIVIENVSYYAAPWHRMRESDFINAVPAAADCGLLLDGVLAATGWLRYAAPLPALPGPACMPSGA